MDLTATPAATGSVPESRTAASAESAGSTGTLPNSFNRMEMKYAIASANVSGGWAGRVKKWQKDGV